MHLKNMHTNSQLLAFIVDVIHLFLQRQMSIMSAIIFLCSKFLYHIFFVLVDIKYCLKISHSVNGLLPILQLRTFPRHEGEMQRTDMSLWEGLHALRQLEARDKHFSSNLLSCYYLTAGAFL